MPLREWTNVKAEEAETDAPVVCRGPGFGGGKGVGGAKPEGGRVAKGIGAEQEAAGLEAGAALKGQMRHRVPRRVHLDGGGRESLPADGDPGGWLVGRIGLGTRKRPAHGERSVPRQHAPGQQGLAGSEHQQTQGRFIRRKGGGFQIDLMVQGRIDAGQDTPGFPLARPAPGNLPVPFGLAPIASEVRPPFGLAETKQEGGSGGGRISHAVCLRRPPGGRCFRRLWQMCRRHPV